MIIGGALIGGVYYAIDTRNDGAKLFANKERCAVYTKKRQAETEKKREITGVATQVQGFYSPTANTCITNSQEIVINRYIQRTLIDELTGKTEAFVIATMGDDLKSLSLEEKKDQIKQDQFFGERLKYFQGEQ